MRTKLQDWSEEDLADAAARLALFIGDVSHLFADDDLSILRTALEAIATIRAEKVRRDEFVVALAALEEGYHRHVSNDEDRAIVESLKWHMMDLQGSL